MIGTIWKYQVYSSKIIQLFLYLLETVQIGSLTKGQSSRSVSTWFVVLKALDMFGSLIVKDQYSHLVYPNLCIKTNL